MNYLCQFQYNEEILGSYIDVLIGQPTISESAQRLLCHILNAIEIWMSRVEGRPAKVDVWQMHKLDELHGLNKSLHESVFRVLETGNLRKVHLYKNSSGSEFLNTLDEVLTHLIIHSAHHRAQIAAIWSAEGIKPPPSDFIFWAREKSR